MQHAIVDQAVSDWESILDQAILTQQPFLLGVEFLDLGPAVDGLTLSVEEDPRGLPVTASIALNNNERAYFDPDPLTSDDIPLDATDMLTAARHEIGHALGFDRRYSRFANCEQTSQVFSCRNVAASLTGDDQPHLATSAHPSDLMNPTVQTGPPGRLPISELDRQILSVAIGYNPGAHFVYALDLGNDMSDRRDTGRSRCEDALVMARRDLRQLFDVFPEETNSAVSLLTFGGESSAALNTDFGSLASALEALENIDPFRCQGSSPVANSLCSGFQRLALEAGPYVATGDLFALLSSHGQQQGGGLCSGSSSTDAEPPYTPESWQFNVREALLSQQITLSTRLWLDSGVEQKRNENFSKASPSSSAFFDELARSSGGTFTVAADDNATLPSPILTLFADGLESERTDMVQLVVNLSGNGGGRVIGRPTGIDCPDACTQSVPANSFVRLDVFPNAESALSRWSGACDGTSLCSVLMDRDRFVTANFRPRAEVSLEVTPTFLDAGQPVTVSWNVADFVEGEVVCIPSGGTAQWRADVTDTPSGGTGSYVPEASGSFVLDCGEDSAEVEYTVFPGTTDDGFPPPPGFCDGQPAGRALPFDIFRDFELNPPDGQPKFSFQEVWDSWPGSGDATVLIPQNQYVALPFPVTAPAGNVWLMTWLGGPSNGDATQVSISRCPGDFSGVGYSDERCLVSAGAEGATITVVVGPGNACSVNTGEIYYFNVRHARPDGLNGCNDGSRCGFLGIPRIIN